MAPEWAAHPYATVIWGPCRARDRAPGSRLGTLQAERAVRVEQASGVLEVHVVSRRAGLPVTALQEQNFLRDSSCDGRGEAALPRRDTRKRDASAPQATRVRRRASLNMAGERGSSETMGLAPGPLIRREKTGLQCTQRAAGVTLFWQKGDMVR